MVYRVDVIRQKSTSRDESWMRLALEQAAQGEGMTRPNPPVGAVVVRNGRVCGRGFHPKAGQPHAEVFALTEAGAAAKGATLYVTLEPCSTHGRTPACTEGILRAGIARVVYGCVDPNPAHSGRADAILRAAGIEVVAGVLKTACEVLIEPFACHLLKRRPLVTVKLACTLDGRIADRRGRSQWITGPVAREAVHTLRRGADAILVGAETIRADNPSLLPRPALGREPWRVVVGGHRPLPRTARVLTDGAAERTVVMAARGSPLAAASCFGKPGGPRLVTLPKAGGGVSLPAMMRAIAKLDCLRVVCEGGGVLAGALAKAGLVDEWWFFYAPRLLGGEARPALAGHGWALPGAPVLRVERVEQLGDDVLIVARPPLF